MGVAGFSVVSTGCSPDSLACLDSFAALHMYPTGEPEIAGFRFMRAKEARHSLLLKRVTRPIVRPLPLLFFGALALAILARPSSEPHAALSHDVDNLARFAYAQPSTAFDARVEGQARLEFAAFTQGPSDVGSGSSPITTSALPTATRTPVREVLAEPAHLGVPPLRIETLAAAPPRLVRLAAAAPEDTELAPVPPMVEIVTPSPSDDPGIFETKSEPGPEAAHRSHAPKPRAASAHKRRAKNASKKVSRAPRWAQQMFDNPWQSSAFSYVR